MKKRTKNKILGVLVLLSVFIGRSAFASNSLSGAGLVLIDMVQRMNLKPQSTGWICMSMGEHDIYQMDISDQEFSKIYVKTAADKSCTSDSIEQIKQAHGCLAVGLVWAKKKAAEVQADYPSNDYEVRVSIYSKTGATREDRSFSHWVMSEISQVGFAKAQAAEASCKDLGVRLDLVVHSENQESIVDSIIYPSPR